MIYAAYFQFLDWTCKSRLGFFLSHNPILFRRENSFPLLFRFVYFFHSNELPNRPKGRGLDEITLF